MGVRLPVVAHVFLVRNDTVLLARRADTGFEDGKYGPVGGRLEPGESIMQAAVRECWEEIGVQLGPGDLKVIGVTHYTSPMGDGVDFFLRAERWTGELVAKSECDDLRWCNFYSLPQNTIPFVRRALEQHLIKDIWFDETGFSWLRT